MVRIIYEWEVAAGDIAAFRETWRETTGRIHATVAGARGSFLLQEEGDPGRILTVARWDSVEYWRAFWRQEDPAQMHGMRALGRRVAVRVYDEFEDHTV